MQTKTSHGGAGQGDFSGEEKRRGGGRRREETRGRHMYEYCPNSPFSTFSSVWLRLFLFFLLFLANSWLPTRPAKSRPVDPRAGKSLIGTLLYTTGWSYDIYIPRLTNQPSTVTSLHQTLFSIYSFIVLYYELAICCVDSSLFYCIMALKNFPVMCMNVCIFININFNFVSGEVQQREYPLRPPSSKTSELP